MIKAIFFDLDGTIISFKTGIYSPAIKHAFNALQSKGILLFAATGRSPYELKITRMIDGLQFDAIVSMNGQYCYNDNETILSRTFDKKILAQILEQIKQTPFPCATIEKDAIYISEINEYVKAAQAAVNTPTPRLGTIFDALNREVLMITVYVPKNEESALLNAIENVSVARWHEYAIDIVPEGCGKCAGIEAVLQKYSLSWEDVMAFGDGENDYEMLKKAKYGIAMGNSSNMLLNGDFYITEDVDNEGVISALQHFHIL